MGTLIKTDTSVVNVVPKNGKTFSLKELQELVGGNIELLVLPTGKEMYLNEDGKSLGLPVNSKATKLARTAGIALWDQVLGDVVLPLPSEVE